MIRLKELRIEKGINQKTVAKQLNCSQTTYSDWERGRSEPSLEILIQMANFFECSVDYLLGLESGSYSSLSFSEFSDEEKSLLLSFRLLSSHEKIRVKGYIDCLIEKYKSGI